MCVFVHACMPLVLESCAGHASRSEESRYAVQRHLYVSVGHLSLVTWQIEWKHNKKQ